MGTRSMLFLDWAMEYYLCEKENFEILEGFLSELLQRKVVIRQIEESERIYKERRYKFNEVVMPVEIDDKELCVVELQHGGTSDYYWRKLYRVNNSLTDYVNRGGVYSGASKLYSINVAYFEIGEGKDYIYHGFTDFRGLHNKKQLKLDVLQRALCTKYVNDGMYPECYIISTDSFDNKEPKNTLDEWMFYLKYSKIRDSFTAQGMDRARKILLEGNLTDEEKRQYERSIDSRRNDDSIVYTAFFTGKLNGMLEKWAKDQALAQKDINTVLNSNKAGLPIETIANITVLTPEEVINIIENN